MPERLTRLKSFRKEIMRRGRDEDYDNRRSECVKITEDYGRGASSRLSQYDGGSSGGEEEQELIEGMEEST